MAKSQDFKLECFAIFCYQSLRVISNLVASSGLKSRQQSTTDRATEIDLINLR